ncbi:unnamed protein product [Darwinula stevensoni]|uniref:Uncharacterized protein n=1 Tax=Darwinula stevensoni TaxID=69355 RepID=A0A7R8ZZS1_9CRUS|nr:unnamed protein product [Darwinula stevensoni]CAG0884310.1 unnamed protein product [Darwinula stevensoni]
MEPFAYLCLAFAFLLPLVAGQGKCPEADEIRPCTCGSHDPDIGFHQPDLDCSKARTSGAISSVLRKNSWPTTLFWEFRLQDNENVEKLPRGVSGILSFQSIRIKNTSVETVHPSFILQSNDRLLVLEIQNSRLKAFPSHILHQLPNLLTLNLRNNSLTDLPALQSASLRVLHLQFNNITRVEADGWDTPNLRVFDISANPSLEVPPGVLKTMETLERFWCPRCNLGPTLSTGALQFNSKALKTVGLSENEIARMEPDALTENPIECDCALDWLISDSKILKSVRGTCVDGTDFGSLALNCRTCPFECVSREEASSCEPGTAITANVGNCQSSELCCQRMAPEANTTSSPAPVVKAECTADYPRIENAKESFEGWTGEDPAPEGAKVLFTCEQGFADGSATHTATCSPSSPDAWSATFKEDERTTLCPPSRGAASTDYPECRSTEKGREYVGTKNKTETGKECLRWDSKPYGTPKDFSPIEDYEGHFPNRDRTSVLLKTALGRPFLAGTTKQRLAF